MTHSFFIFQLSSGVNKIVFKVLFFYDFFFKNQKTSKGRIFWFLWFLDIVVFCINYALKPYSYYFFIII